MLKNQKRTKIINKTRKLKQEGPRRGQNPNPVSVLRRLFVYFSGEGEHCLLFVWFNRLVLLVN